MLMSDTHTEIFKARIKYRSRAVNPKKDKVNPHFNSKYASLDSIISTCGPILAECGLDFFQDEVHDKEGHIGVYTMLIHESGEWIKFNPVYVKTDTFSQKVGSALTYAKRYSLGLALGIATDEDDDGNIASEPPKTQKTQSKAKQQSQKQTSAKSQQAPVIEPAAQKQGNGDLDAFKNLAEKNKAESNPRGRYWAIAGKKGFKKEDLNVLIWGAYRVESHTELNDTKFTYLADYLDRVEPERFNLAIECFRLIQNWQLSKDQQKAIFFYIGKGKTDWRAFSVAELTETIEFLSTASVEDVIRTVEAMQEVMDKGAA